ncbi:MAG TPA: hypothetical protein VL693_06275 [Vicinamibacterales bacterium]|jgi:hypothetical protein|nr:hypothetical protein [Vicinamibacterales bacterium]
MAHPLATYTFLPWLRQGLSNSITQDESSPNPSLRADVDVQVMLHVESIGAAIPDVPIPRAVGLFGPGDVIGIERRAIVKTEPKDWITNFESNYLAHVEFYDEDFPWRYTPARADRTAHRHRPWIALVVLEEGEFTDGDATGKPLPFIDVTDLTMLPAKEELWAWAHVHVNRNLGTNETEIVSSDGAAIAGRLDAVLGENPDLAYSRLVCPRQLEPNKAYHAFLVPTFETGRVAGLALDLTKVDDAMRGAWEAHPQRANLSGNSLPYYHRWYFRTGNAGDFEYLVRLLQPQPMDARVGRRDIDVQRPATYLNGITGPDNNGVLRLGGALKVPDEALTDDQIAEADRFERWDEPRPHQFQRDLAAFINLADEYSDKTAEDAHNAPDVPDLVGALPDGETDPDPVITPPLYGTWHSLTKRLLKKRDGTPEDHLDNWVHRLNLDPRHRAAAGLGTKVVRDRQEDYMNAAWQQIGDVLEANRLMRLAQLGKAVSLSWHTRHLTVLQQRAPEQFLAVAGPINKRIVAGGSAYTVHKQIVESRVPTTATSTAMRRVVRPNGRLTRVLAPAEGARVVGMQIVQRLNAGTLTSAQPPAVPPGAATVTGIARALVATVPAWIVDLVRTPGLLFWALIAGLIVALLLVLIGLGALAMVIAVLVVGAFTYLRRQAAVVEASDAILPERETVESVATLPADASFSVTPFGGAFEESASRGPDSADAQRFKTALRSALELARDESRVNVPMVRTVLDLPALASDVLTAIDPARTIPRRFYKNVRIPDRIRDGLREDFVEAMAYPRIDEAMFRPLTVLGSELFLPNIGLIPQNSISLLETNQPFIESYMVGLNHEFARELLFREYPTDQRGSYFRQFWDVSGYRETEGLSADALREKLYDIPKLHKWSKDSTLGAHDNRQPPGSEPRDEVVLSIRGELLKRYPTAVIYAHKADWQRTNGVIDKSLIREPIALTDAEESDPPRDKVKTPLYEARVDPDITFFGFDLTVAEAKGNPETDDAGWFFVIKERPGEPRFGLDIDRGGSPINTWSDLAWGDVTTEQHYLRIRPGMQTHELTVAPPSTEGEEEMEQHLEDRQFRWNENTNAADVAYVLYQLPVLVAVHAAEMLPKD